MNPTQYRPSRRSWVKLWVNEWLTGTVRWQLTPEQRAIWTDLLALAGFSRFPGIVCSGEDNGVLVAYPMDWLCTTFRCEETAVRAAFQMFVQQGRIVIENGGVIRIVNWSKYQSEYQSKRQRRTYGNVRPNVHKHRKKCPPQEVEVEEEGERELKVKDVMLRAFDESSQQERPCFGIPLNDGTQHLVWDRDIKRYRELYPSVDLDREFRAMVGWCEANPTRLKTKRGIRRFVNNWLMQAQDRPSASRSNGNREAHAGYNPAQEQLERWRREQGKG